MSWTYIRNDEELKQAFDGSFIGFVKYEDLLKFANIACTTDVYAFAAIAYQDKDGIRELIIDREFVYGEYNNSEIRFNDFKSSCAPETDKAWQVLLAVSSGDKTICGKSYEEALEIANNQE